MLDLLGSNVSISLAGYQTRTALSVHLTHCDVLRQNVTRKVAAACSCVQPTAGGPPRTRESLMSRPTAKTAAKTQRSKPLRQIPPMLPITPCPVELCYKHTNTTPARSQPSLQQITPSGQHANALCYKQHWRHLTTCQTCCLRPAQDLLWCLPPPFSALLPAELNWPEGNHPQQHKREIVTPAS